MIKYINKWTLNEDGMRVAFKGRNVEQDHIMHATHHNVEELVQNGPWHPDRIIRTMGLGYKPNYFDQNEEWEPTVVGYGLALKN
jgi:hypothetical protein